VTVTDMQNFEVGRLTVLGRADNKGAQARWLCGCECGAVKVVRGDHLRSMAIQSCGCLRRESSRKTGKKERHGMSFSLTYSSWRAMLKRCYDRNHVSYDDYGGRGITVCQAWIDDFRNFLCDMKERTEGLTLDRINVNGNYEPGNCRWSDYSTQNSNKRLSLRF
jgi:hypothetical protein